MLVLAHATLLLVLPLRKKDTSVTFWAERNFLCHTYDTSMTIIVTKPGIIIYVVGSYFYEKMTENGLFVLGGPETQLHDILWTVHDGKNHGIISRSCRLRWEVGGRAMRVSLVHVRGIGSN